MARKITKKPDRVRFAKEVRKLIESFGVLVKMDDEHRTEYRMNTKAGPLTISIHKRDLDLLKSPCTIFTRFDHALMGKNLCGASVPSGKRNFHFHEEYPIKDAMEDINVFLEKIKPTSLEEFCDNTALIPDIIVDTVLRERGIVGLRMCDPSWMGEKALYFDEAVEWFTKHCEDRLIYIYDSNPYIKAVFNKDGRDTAYAFVNHWLDAYLESPPKYRETHPSLRAA